MFKVLDLMQKGVFMPDVDWAGRFVDDQLAPDRQEDAVDEACSSASSGDDEETDGGEDPGLGPDVVYLYNQRTRACHLERETGVFECGKSVTLNIIPVPEWPSAASKCLGCFRPK